MALGVAPPNAARSVGEAGDAAVIGLRVSDFGDAIPYLRMSEAGSVGISPAIMAGSSISAHPPSFWERASLMRVAPRVKTPPVPGDEGVFLLGRRRRPTHASQTHEQER